MTISISVNGEGHEVEADPDTPLLYVLRDDLELNGAKYGCGLGQCGACTVHVDGVARRACVTAIDSIGNSVITTVEGVGATEPGRRVQQAWLDLDVVQCGYCQSGQIMSAVALIAKTPHPTDADIDSAMSGTICRCGTYIRIREAIKHAAAATPKQGG